MVLRLGNVAFNSMVWQLFLSMLFFIKGNFVRSCDFITKYICPLNKTLKFWELKLIKMGMCKNTSSFNP